MRRVTAAVALNLLAWGSAVAGELVFANGTHLAGELSSESLMLSTGTGLIELVPEEITLLSRDQVRLRDGRVIRGTLVGGQIRARTALGEIAIRVDELERYQRTAPAAASAVSASATPERGPATPSSVAAAAAPPAAPAAPVERSATTTPASTGTGDSGLPTLASYQDGQPASRALAASGSTMSVKPAVLTYGSVAMSMPRLEVVGDGTLYRDALFGSSEVGAVSRGQQVIYVDSIDRRLRILNRLVFDGGYWIKVRRADGIEGWIPAESVRELR